MSTLELLRLALWHLRASPVRAMLTMLGVIIGVASLVALVGVGRGAASQITTQLEALGSNLLTVNPGSAPGTVNRQATSSVGSLTLDDAIAIAGLDGVSAVEPEIAIQALVVAGSQSSTTSVVGTGERFPDVRAYTVQLGSFFNAASNDNALRVAVLGAQTASTLGLGGSSIGGTITINRLPFELVGILDRKGVVGPVNNDDVVLIPVTTMRRYFNNTDRVRSVGVSVASADRIPEVKVWVATLLEQRHVIPSGGPDDFTVQDQAQLLGTVSSVSELLSALLAGIAVISLLVGGIGIMNVMLAAVRERTREIGLRKAVGAHDGDIVAQFLTEALTVSALGGLLGIVVGVAASGVISRSAGWSFAFDPVSTAVAFAISVAVGCVCGAWPARQAAHVDPIVALRYE